MLGEFKTRRRAGGGAGRSSGSDPEVGEPGENSDQPFKRRGCGQVQGWVWQLYLRGWPLSRCVDSDVHPSACSLCPFPVWSHTLILKQPSAAPCPRSRPHRLHPHSPLSNIELNHFLTFRKETPSREMPPSSPPPPVLSNKSRR